METVLYEKSGHIARLVMNRPEKLNAMNAQLREDLLNGLDQAIDDPEVRVVILKGNGRAFCSGADRGGGGSSGSHVEDVGESQKRARDGLKFYLRFWDSPKPIIAQVHGYCLGVGTQLPIFCDITMVSEECRVGWPMIPNGGASISPMWLWLVGPKRAKEGSFALRQLTGSEAAEWGWANRAVPAALLEQETEALAKDISRLPTELLRVKKQAINQVVEMMGFRTAIGFTAELNPILHHSADVLAMEQKMRDLGWQQFQKIFQEEGFE